MCDDFCVGIYPVAFGPVYAASKHGVIGFTRSMGVKFCPYMNLVGKYRIQQFVIQLGLCRCICVGGGGVSDIFVNSVIFKKKILIHNTNPVSLCKAYIIMFNMCIS